ncbi:MAG: hypothetical protein V3V84_08340 [Candidatus Bathyarchaeia archaeon]
MGGKRKQKIIAGDPWVIDDVDGHPRRYSEVRKDWRGYQMSYENWSHKEEQLTIQVQAENPAFPDARPRKDPVFLAGQAAGDKPIPPDSGLPPGLSFEN